MEINKINNLAAELMEYSTELTKREIEATKNADFETLKKLNETKSYIIKLLEALDEE